MIMIKQILRQVTICLHNSTSILLVSLLVLGFEAHAAENYLPDGRFQGPSQGALATSTTNTQEKSGGIPKLQSPLSDLFLNLNNKQYTDAPAPDTGLSPIETYPLADTVNVVVVLENETFVDAIKTTTLQWGGTVTAAFETRLEITLPIVQLKNLSELAGVVYVRQPIPVFPLDSNSAPANFSTGNYVTQGVNKSRANLWHNKGIDGRGVKIGIIDSFKDYTSAQSNGNLPASVTRYGTIDYSSRHGTAVAEIIYDMAPGASLTIASPGSATQMAQQIVGLARAGNKIISSSTGFYLDEPGDGTGTVSSAINTATNSYGALYVQAAGNQAQYHWDGRFSDSDGNGYLNFSGQTEVNQIGNLAKDRYINLNLRWNAWPTTNQDYDLFVVLWNESTSTWEIVASSENTQNGTQPPTESIVGTVITPGYYGFIIQKVSANGNQTLDIMGHNAPAFQFNKSSRSLVDPATAQRSFSVAAVDVNTNILESYSSWGPTHGPGGALTGGRAKPRISGFANVDTWAYGPGQFNGTSAATPHVAGAAALIRQAYPLYSPLQVAETLEKKAIDRGSAGYDLKFGYGQLYLGTPPDLKPVGFLPAVYSLLLLE